MENKNEYIDVPQVAELLRVSRQMVYKLIRKGLPHIIVGEKLIRFEAAKVRAWINNSEVRSANSEEE